MEQPGQEEGITPPPTAFGSRPQSKSEKRLYLQLVLGLAVLGWGIYIGGRYAAGYLATSAPYSWDQSLGELAKKQFLAGAQVCSNPELVNAVGEIVENLASGLEAEFRDIKVYIIQDEQVNAFALPGGYVFVLTGLLERLESSEELIGVLGHELGHVVERHGLKRIAQAAWFNFIVLQLFGDITGMGELVTVKALQLVETGFDRDQERESDTFGLELMYRVGYAPKDYPRFFDRLPTYGMPEFLATHPEPGSRAITLREEIARRPGPARVIRPPKLASLKAPCQLN